MTTSIPLRHIKSKKVLECDLLKRADYDIEAVGVDQENDADRPCVNEKILDPARWVEDNGDALYRFAFVRLGNPHDAEEAVQECLLAALHGGESFASRSLERTWLLGILKHKIIDSIRRAARQRSPKGIQPDARFNSFSDKGFWQQAPQRWHEDPSVAIQRKEFGPVLLDCLSKLPKSMADAIILRELNQLPSDEVCQTLGISSQTLWQRLHRARLGLRRCLELNWFDRGSKEG